MSLESGRRAVLLANLKKLVLDPEWGSYRWLTPAEIVLAQRLADEAGVELEIRKVDFSEWNRAPLPKGVKHGKR